MADLSPLRNCYLVHTNPDRAIAYCGDHAAGPDAVAEAHNALVLRVLPSPQQVLLTHVVGTIVDHEAATLHLAGVAAAQVGGHVGAVAAALIGATLEVPVLVKDDLVGGKREHAQTVSGFGYLSCRKNQQG